MPIMAHSTLLPATAPVATISPPLYSSSPSSPTLSSSSSSSSSSSPSKQYRRQQRRLHRWRHDAFFDLRKLSFHLDVLTSASFLFLPSVLPYLISVLIGVASSPSSPSSSAASAETTTVKDSSNNSNNNSHHYAQWFLVTLLPCLGVLIPCGSMLLWQRVFPLEAKSLIMTTRWTQKLTRWTMNPRRVLMLALGMWTTMILVSSILGEFVFNHHHNHTTSTDGNRLTTRNGEIVTRIGEGKSCHPNWHGPGSERRHHESLPEEFLVQVIGKVEEADEDEQHQLEQDDDEEEEHMWKMWNLENDHFGKEFNHNPQQQQQQQEQEQEPQDDIFGSDHYRHPQVVIAEDEENEEDDFEDIQRDEVEDLTDQDEQPPSSINNNNKKNINHFGEDIDWEAMFVDQQEEEEFRSFLKKVEDELQDSGIAIVDEEEMEHVEAPLSESNQVTCIGGTSSLGQRLHSYFSSSSTSKSTCVSFPASTSSPSYTSFHGLWTWFILFNLSLCIGTYLFGLELLRVLLRQLVRFRAQELARSSRSVLPPPSPSTFDYSSSSSSSSSATKTTIENPYANVDHMTRWIESTTRQREFIKETLLGTYAIAGFGLLTSLYMVLWTETWESVPAKYGCGMAIAGMLMVWMWVPDMEVMIMSKEDDQDIEEGGDDESEEDFVGQYGDCFSQSSADDDGDDDEDEGGNRSEKEDCQTLIDFSVGFDEGVQQHHYHQMMDEAPSRNACSLDQQYRRRSLTNTAVVVDMD